MKNKQQILIINGGSTYDSYDDYINHLKNLDIKLDRLKPFIDWKLNLQGELGENFEVYLPKMPNVTNAQFDEWKIWFEKVLEKLDDGIILIGHSLGGIFLAKHLEENEPTKRIKATFLISAPFGGKYLDESVGGFEMDTNLENFKARAGKVYLVQSKDDTTVPFINFEKYKELLPNAETLVLDGMGHFKVETIPGLSKLIKNI